MACEVCPLHNGFQPKLSARAKWVVSLYRRVRAYGALPGPGGLLDQDEELMQLLDAAHEEFGAASDGGGKVVKAFGTYAQLMKKG